MIHVLLCDVEVSAHVLDGGGRGVEEEHSADVAEDKVLRRLHAHSATPDHKY
jgi:hypothetical protein